MNRKLHQFFFEPPRGEFAHNLKWKYGFLVALIVLLGGCIWMSLQFHKPSQSETLIRLFLPCTLILNHLTNYFYFGPRFTFPFRLFSVIFLIVGCTIVFAYLWRSMPFSHGLNFNIEVRQTNGADR